MVLFIISFCMQHSPYIPSTQNQAFWSEVEGNHVKQQKQIQEQDSRLMLWRLQCSGNILRDDMNFAHLQLKDKFSANE